jgi:hypothetical protein
MRYCAMVKSTPEINLQPAIFYVFKLIQSAPNSDISLQFDAFPQQRSNLRIQLHLTIVQWFLRMSSSRIMLQI